MFLIIGASGFIGNKLYNYFKSKGLDVKGTYYSKTFESSERDGIYLDFSDPDFSEILELNNLTHIFFCNGITKIDKCKINRDLSYKINVTNTIKLLENFIQTDTIPIFLSSDMVYNGTKKFYKEEDETCPITEYGRQKLTVEGYITKHFKRYIILRLTKVYGVERGDKTLFTSGLDSLLEHKLISSAVDNFISPLFVIDVIHVLDSLVSGKHYGIFNLGGPETLSRYESLIRFANFLGFDDSLIQKCSIKDFKFIEPRSIYNSLDSSKIVDTIGIILTFIEDSFKLINKNYKIK
ncbi:MAG: sugar nucleotide-binding protein [Nanoarchaeota archaeon]|nr:sugar nucleotide-binding protein [Nanoarchaeota archaeon]